MADTHQNRNLLLKSIRLRPLRVPKSLFEPLDSEFETSSSFNTQVDGRKMTFAELMQDSVLLAKPTSVSALGIAEDEAGFIQDGDLICVFELSSFVAPYNSLIHERAVA